MRTNRQRLCVWRTVFIFVCSLCAAEMYSQNNPKFLNIKLQEIASQLSTTYNLECNAPKSVVLPSLCRDKEVVVAMDCFGVINHIGFKLFDRTIAEQNPSPVYNFVERFLLELYLMKDNALIARSLKESKVAWKSEYMKGKSFTSFLSFVLSRINSSQSIVITTDNSRYAVSWFESGHLLFSMRFPIQYELLWGMNKVEAENHFYSDLLTYRTTKAPLTRTEPDPEYLVAINDTCYCLSGDFYGIDAITSNQYYKKTTEGKYIQLVDLKYPAESIFNLFTISSSPRIQAHVTHKMYGGKKNVFDVPLGTLVNFCKAAGCEVYVGAESLEENMLTGVALMVNRALGYNHLFYFTTDVRILSRPADYLMNVQLNAFVPVHNINNLYGDKTTKSKIQ